MSMLTDEQLAEIREHARLTQVVADARESGMALMAARDLTMLLAAYDEQRAENAALREIAQAVADMTDMEPLYRAALYGPVVRPKLDTVHLYSLGRQARALLADDDAPEGE